LIPQHIWKASLDIFFKMASR